jgi:hypothetical protein
MHRLLRYAIALITAGAITAGVRTQYHSVLLLAGTFQVFTAATAIALRYPELILDTESENRLASAAFAGVVTFGFIGLTQGINTDFHLGAGILGYGLAIFGLVTGFWMVDNHST